MNKFAIAVAGVVAGVVLPKIVPMLALRGDPPPAAQRWFVCIVPALLGALTVPMVGRFAASLSGTVWLPAAYVAAYIVIGAVAARVRRTAVSFGVGVLVLAALQVARVVLASGSGRTP